MNLFEQNISSIQAEGQQRPLKILREELITKSRRGSYILEGPKSVGKRYLLLSLLKELMDHSAKIDKATHPDLLDINPVKGVIKIDAIRQAIYHFQFPPLEAPVRAAVINEADTMNSSAANALLKVLEEPPPHALIFLVTSNPFLMLPTILSRCKRVRFNPVSNEQLAKTHNLAIEDASLLEFVEHDVENDRSEIPAALQEIKKESNSIVSALTTILRRSTPVENAAPARWNFGSHLTDDEDKIELRLKLLGAFVRDSICHKVECQQDLLVFRHHAQDIKSIADNLTLDKLVRIKDEIDGRVRGLIERSRKQKSSG